MNTVYVSTKMPAPEKVGGKTQGVPCTLKTGGNVHLSTHGSTPDVYECIALSISDTRALWRSGLSARAPECQKLTMVG